MMNIELRPVCLAEREILGNLLEKYHYEFSQYDRRDVNQLGLYGYRYLDHYWTEEKRWAYFIVVDRNLAGFIMINAHSDLLDRKTDFAMAEFFIMHKYRRLGVGRQAFTKLLKLHPGTWQIKRHPQNLAAVLFWNRAIDEHTGGDYELIESCPEIKYADGTAADVLLFQSP